VTGPALQTLLDARRTGPGFLWLIDPDKIDTRRPDPRWETASETGVTAFLVGTSQSGNDGFDCAVAFLRKHTRLPLILFPGSASQVSPHVDAVLFLSLLSGRNPDYLVGEQVKGTPLLRDYGIEPIPTGYILVDTGTLTSVARQSGTHPIPESEAESICDHALCAQYMGKALVYLEAGSGAKAPIGGALIRRVKDSIAIPLVVGGGIRTPEACANAVGAGADFVVVGTALETDRSGELLRELCDAAHSARGVPTR
jgi:phosphoglycerol geranylgeranyltransferase